MTIPSTSTVHHHHSNLPFLSTKILVKHLRRRALDIRLQRRRPIIPNRHGLRKRLRNPIPSLRAGMRIVLRVQRVDLLAAQPRIHIRDRLEMIHKARPLANVPRRRRRISHKPRHITAKLPILPRILGRLRAQHDLGALGDERARRLLEVGVVRVDGLARLARLADLGAGAGAVGAAVVRRRVGRAAVVVAKSDDDDVARHDGPLDLGEASLVGVAARRAARDGFVDDGDGDVLAQIRAPACRVLEGGVRGRGGGHTVKAVAGLGHGAVSGEVDGGVRALGHVDGVGRGGRREGGDETRQLGEHGGRWFFGPGRLPGN